MTKEQNSNIMVESDTISREEAIELLFGKGSASRGAQIETEAEVENIAAGLPCLKPLPQLSLHPDSHWRIKTLRISLNREIRLTLEDMDLGVGKASALETARACIKKKIISPSDEIIPHLEAVLQQDDLYNEEFISNRDVLQSLLQVLLDTDDFEAIATAAAETVRLRVLATT
jgi:hypothetical protein